MVEGGGYFTLLLYILHLEVMQESERIILVEAQDLVLFVL